MHNDNEYFACTFALGGTPGRGTRVREIPCDVYQGFITTMNGGTVPSKMRFQW